MIVCPPGAEHVALHRPGTTVTYVMPEVEQLTAMGDQMGRPVEIPRVGTLVRIQSSPATELIGAAVNRQADAAHAGDPLDAHSESVLSALVGVLAGDPLTGRHEFGRGLDSRSIVAGCIDYAESIDRIPALSELCLAAHVSERRLRSAFTQEFDCAPTPYFRNWALDRVHRRLRDSGSVDRTVTEVASDVGFGHLGRFAGWYRRVYGETPSTTLHHN